MKPTLVFLLFALLFTESLKSQGGNSALSQGPQPLPIFPDDINGRPFTYKGIEDVEGSPFLFNDWNWGAVKFRDGRFAKDLSLQFNIYNNQLYFKKEGKQMEFVLPVAEFMIRYSNGNDSSTVIYRCGYPETEKTSSITFFELLIDGKLQLLKYRSKQINTSKPFNQAERREFSDQHQLYVNVDRRLIKLKKDKEFIIGILPVYKDAINSIVDQKKLKLKNEEDVMKLFEELNRK